MHQKMLALVNDVTGYGRCSIAVALPIVSALKVQGCILPTAILSVHTGFHDYYLDDYTDHMTPYIDSWKKNRPHLRRHQHRLSRLGPTDRYGPRLSARLQGDRIRRSSSTPSWAIMAASMRRIPRTCATK